MKKTIISLCLVIALVATAIAGATLAYFTDDDSARNVMNLGNVAIVQNEQEADGSDFVQNKIMMPAVFTEEITGENILVDGKFNPAIKNVIDKFVSVTNEGSRPAYVRTLIAFEGTYAEHDNLVYVNGSYKYLKDANGDVVEITLNGKTFCLAYKVYEDAIEAGETSGYSLRQLFFAPHTVNEDMAQFGDTYDILVISQAVQSEGFADAETALNTAFGVFSADTAMEWFKDISNY